MANRVLRDTTDSEVINSLTWPAEVLFYRLFMKADDFGSFHANPKLIKGALYPLKDDMREADISRYLNDLQIAGLILLYESSGKGYLRILNFGQRLRNMRSKFPGPENESAANCGDSPPETKRNETETETRNKKPKQEGNLIEVWFLDLENSSNLETIARVLSVPIETVKNFIPAFRVKAELSYPDHNRFINHFKNFVNKELNAKPTTKNDRRSKLESIDELEELSRTVLRANDGFNG